MRRSKKGEVLHKWGVEGNIVKVIDEEMKETLSVLFPTR